jgi:hypothetical protein
MSNLNYTGIAGDNQTLWFAMGTCFEIFGSK